MYRSEVGKADVDVSIARYLAQFMGIEMGMSVMLVDQQLVFSRILLSSSEVGETDFGISIERQLSLELIFADFVEQICHGLHITSPLVRSFTPSSIFFSCVPKSGKRMLMPNFRRESDLT